VLARERSVTLEPANEVRVTDHKDRRQFLQYVASSGTFVLVSWPVSAAGVAFGDSLASGRRVLTSSQAALVGAIVGHVVPTDDYPGGREAGVVAYIDGILAGPFGRFYKDLYEEGLKTVDETSRKRFMDVFTSLDASRQAAILASLESEEDSTGHQFLELILRHTYEGYYGDPQHGGNLDGASWKMIGFAG
jgi:gluconate 2-dehydrogenase gamma chain